MTLLFLVVLQFLAGCSVLACLGGGRRLASAGAVYAAGLATTVLLELANRWFGTASLGVLLVELAVVAIPGLTNARRYFAASRNAFLPSRRPLRTCILLLVCLHLLAIYLYVWFAGVPVANYDVLSYHIPLAWGLAQTDHALSPLFSPATFYARMPLGGSLLESRFVGSGLDATGPGLHLFLIITAFAGANSAARCAGWLGARRAGRLLASLLFLFHPLLTSALVNAVMEPMVALMAIAGAELILAGAARSGRPGHQMAAGLLAGTAMAIKFSAAGTAIIPLGIVAGCYALRHARTGNYVRCLREPLLFGAGVLVAMAPWFARGVVLGGHPMYPFKGGDAHWVHDQAQFVVDQHHPQSPVSLGYWADFAKKNGSLGYRLGVIPLTFMGVLALWAAARRPATCLPLLLAAGAGYCAWLTVRLNPDRFLVGSAMLLVPPAALAACMDLGRTRGKVSPLEYRQAVKSGATRQVRVTISAFNSLSAKLGSAGLMLTIAVLLCIQFPFVRDSFTVPAIYRTAARRAQVEPEKIMRIVDIATDEAQRGRLLLLFEARAGLFPGNTEYTTVWDQPSWAPLLRGCATDGAFAQRLRDAGYTGILVNEAEWGRLLDFYGRQWTGSRESLYGRFGIMANLPPDQMLVLLRSFPPYHFAGFTDAELQVLANFLLSQRMQTVVAAPVPGGYNCEVWFATIKVSGGTGAGDSLLRERKSGT